jgi:hypothetical protein
MKLEHSSLTSSYSSWHGLGLAIPDVTDSISLAAKSESVEASETGMESSGSFLKCCHKWEIDGRSLLLLARRALPEDKAIGILRRNLRGGGTSKNILMAVYALCVLGNVTNIRL